MTSLITDLRRALVLTLLLTILCCGAYPLAIWAGARVLFPHQAGGSLIRGEQGLVRGSRLLGQSFTGPAFFHPRPSAAGTGYDATSSGGSNLGPTSQALRDSIAARVAAYRKENGLAPQDPVPADAVTASGSGLDPHISPRNALLQAARVAHERRVPETRLRDLIQQNTEAPWMGILGDPAVNVLQLNLALEAAAPRTR